MTTAVEPPKRRIFFALWPDDETRRALERATRRAVRSSGGKPTPIEKLHVTVAFLGHVDAAAFARAEGVPPIPVGPFDLVLDALGHSGRSRILWLTCRQIPPPLATLEQELWRRLTALGFEREPRLFRPHVTLARGARAVRAETAAVEWPVRELALVESVPDRGGTRYEVLRRWSL